MEEYIAVTAIVSLVSWAAWSYYDNKRHAEASHIVAKGKEFVAKNWIEAQDRYQEACGRRDQAERRLKEATIDCKQAEKDMNKAWNAVKIASKNADC